MTKVHIHEDQFDGVAHAWCGRGNTAVTAEVFEATEPSARCQVCDREWFPRGQPEWHLIGARKLLANASQTHQNDAGHVKPKE